jgi:hypothetical protein
LEDIDIAIGPCVITNEKTMQMDEPRSNCIRVSKSGLSIFAGAPTKTDRQKQMIIEVEDTFLSQRRDICLFWLVKQRWDREKIGLPFVKLLR